MPRLAAVALDLDGTLLESDGTIRTDTLETLGRIAHAGVRVLLATGRPPADIAALTTRTGLGALGLPHAAVANERDLLLRQDAKWVAIQPRNDERQAAEHALSLELRPAVTALWAELAAIDPTCSVWGPDRIRDRGFIELHFQTAEQAVRAGQVVRRQLLEGHPATPHLIANRRLFALRHARSGKGANLHELCGLLGVDPARVLAVGDAENDRSMLDRTWGFLPAAPANAEPAIAALVAQGGGFVATLPNGAGVAAAVHAHLP